MLTGSKFITQGIKNDVPSFLQNILWYMIETMETNEKDYLQVFHLNSVVENGKTKQQIIHSQDQPNYRKEYSICAKEIVSAKVYVIDNATHSTMLLADE